MLRRRESYTDVVMVEFAKPKHDVIVLVRMHIHDAASNGELKPVLAGSVLNKDRVTDEQTLY
jgi:hypothetical protein